MELNISQNNTFKINTTKQTGDMSLKLHHSKDYHNYLNDVIENELLDSNNNTNESLWVNMGNQLEIEGIPKKEISLIIKKDIEDILYEKEFKDQMSREECRYTNSHYFRVMKSNGWTNPFMARNNKLDPLGDQPDSSINTQNSKMLLLCDSIIEICRTIKEKSKDCESLEDIFGEKQMNEFYKQRHTMINNCKNAIDNKTKIPQNTESFLLECLSTVLGNTNKCAEIFQQVILMHMKMQGKFLTQKQATKFQSGGKQSKLFLLSPTSRDFAIFEGYTGTRCSNCQSYRVRPKADHTTDWECYDCDNIMPKQHIPKCTHCHFPLYTERLTQIAKTGKCSNCHGTVDLPQELVNYTKS